MTCTVLIAAPRRLVDELWSWSAYRYALACRRPIAEYCTDCPTLQTIDPDGEGRLTPPGQGGPERVASCGVGPYRVIGYQPAWGGGGTLRYFDTQGRMVAAFQESDTDINRSTCRQSTVWYGPLVLCRYGPQPDVH
jgi:hypothetical protein